MKKGCLIGVLFFFFVVLLFIAPWRSYVTFGYEIIRVEKNWGEVGARLQHDTVGKDKFLTTSYNSPYTLLFWIELSELETEGAVTIDLLELKDSNNNKTVLQIEEPLKQGLKLEKGQKETNSQVFIEINDLELEIYTEYKLIVQYRIETDAFSHNGTFEETFKMDFDKHRSNNFVKGCMSI
jgi:hypothetical protein